MPVLTPSSGRFHEIPQGASIRLEVQGRPEAPVTFTSFDLGAFQNQLTSITVAADEQGIAQAEFTGTPGTVEDVNILVGSPMASGQVQFRVRVLPPNQ